MARRAAASTRWLGVLLGEPQNAEAGAVALFRVALAGHDAIEQFGGRRTDGLGPVHQPGGRPLQVPLVRLGPVIVTVVAAWGTWLARDWLRAGRDGRSPPSGPVARTSTSCCVS